MTKPMVRIHDTAKDEIIDREMTSEEFKQYQVDAEIQSAKDAEIKSKELSRTALLERLGITADEAALLLG
jgi:hypothetical protein